MGIQTMAIFFISKILHLGACCCPSRPRRAASNVYRMERQKHGSVQFSSEEGTLRRHSVNIVNGNTSSDLSVSLFSTDRDRSLQSQNRRHDGPAPLACVCLCPSFFLAAPSIPSHSCAVQYMQSSAVAC